VGLGFRGDGHKLPLIVEDLISGAIGQPLSRLQYPQRAEVKGIVHNGEYATLARQGEGADAAFPIRPVTLAGQGRRRPAAA
jgi:hypothetical protein